MAEGAKFLRFVALVVLPLSFCAQGEAEGVFNKISKINNYLFIFQNHLDNKREVS